MNLTFKFVSLPPSDLTIISNEGAVDAIIRLAKTYPGEVTMVCLAPLTNLGLALKSDPSVASQLKEVVIMGGNMEGVGNASIAAEFNFHSDPEAAYVVLDVIKCPVILVSWELCMKYTRIPKVTVPYHYSSIVGLTSE